MKKKNPPKEIPLDLRLGIMYNTPRRKEVSKVSPKTGRPIVGEEPKNKQIALRATETTVKKFSECSRISGRTKTDLLEEMVKELYDRLTEK